MSRLKATACTAQVSTVMVNKKAVTSIYILALPTKGLANISLLDLSLFVGRKIVDKLQSIMPKLLSCS